MREGTKGGGAGAGAEFKERWGVSEGKGRGGG